MTGSVVSVLAQQSGDALTAILQFNQPTTHLECDMQYEFEIQLAQLERAAEKIDTYNADNFRQKVKEVLDEGNRKEYREMFDTLRACRHAIQSSDSENRDVKTSARRVIESFSHVEKDYRQIVSSTRRFDRVYHDSRLSAPSDDEKHKSEVLTLSNGLKLEEVREMKRLIQFGRYLSNCVKNSDEAREYINDVKINKTRLYGLLSETGEILGLMTVELKTRTITEFEYAERNGQNIFGERVRCGPFGHRSTDEFVSQGVVSQSDLIEILNVLDATADDNTDFVRLGAFSRFKNGIPEADPVELADGREAWSWKGRNELIVAIDGNGDSERLMKWSRYSRENHRGRFSWDTCESGSMELGELFDIVLSNPQLVEKIRN